MKACRWITGSLCSASLLCSTYNRNEKNGEKKQCVSAAMCIFYTRINHLYHVLEFGLSYLYTFSNSIKPARSDALTMFIMTAPPPPPLPPPPKKKKSCRGYMHGHQAPTYRPNRALIDSIRPSARSCKAHHGLDSHCYTDRLLRCVWIIRSRCVQIRIVAAPTMRLYWGKNIVFYATFCSKCDSCITAKFWETDIELNSKFCLSPKYYIFPISEAFLVQQYIVVPKYSAFRWPLQTLLSVWLRHSHLWKVT